MSAGPRDDQDAEEQSWSTTVRLVGAAQKGDRGALEDLFRRYLPRVRQIVALRLGWKMRQLLDVEDVVQGALLQALQGLKRFEQRSEGSFRNWLARCVEVEIGGEARKARAQKRGAGRVRRLGDYDSGILSSSILAARQATPGEVHCARELEGRLEEALLQMPAHYREVIVLRSVAGLSYGEIAREMGFEKEGAARMAYSRALAKLKEAVGV